MSEQYSFFLFFRLLLLILALGVTLALSVKQESRNAQLKRLIPEMEREVKHLQFENVRLLYEIQCFENPLHLMELSKKPEFGHLKYPLLPDILVVPSEGSLEEKK